MEKLNTYYLPISTANISQYFKKALITPSNNVASWIEDIQCKYKNAILLCKHAFVSNVDSSLTVVFSETEIASIKKISENFYLYEKPIPISRVKNINFFDEKQSKITAYNIEQGDAFIPKSLINIIDQPTQININELDNNNSISGQWNDKIKLYDQLLGGFAIMKIADFHNFEYTKNYFNCLSKINLYVKNQIQDLNFKDDNYFSIIENFNSSAYKQITIEIAQNIAKKRENYELPQKRGLIRLDEIDENKTSYILGILATYGEDRGKSKKISDFISGLLSDTFPLKRLEHICLTFGINQGYSVFRNQYKIQGNTIKTKFELNSELDYTIIESVYQYVFNEKKDNETFKYINEWCPIYESEDISEEFITYEILDRNIAYKKKALIGSAEYFQELFQVFSEDNEISSLFKLLKGDIQNLFKERLKILYKKISSEIEIQHKKKLEQFERENTKLSSEHNSINNSIQVKQDKDVNFDNTINNNDILKSVAKEIKSIDDLKTIAKYIGIDQTVYKTYKKVNIEDLRSKILNYQSLL